MGVRFGLRYRWMRRYALGDDQWDGIKDFLPGREGTLAALRQTTAFCGGGDLPLSRWRFLARSS